MERSAVNPRIRLILRCIGLLLLAVFLIGIFSSTFRHWLPVFKLAHDSVEEAALCIAYLIFGIVVLLTASPEYRVEKHKELTAILPTEVTERLSLTGIVGATAGHAFSAEQWFDFHWRHYEITLRAAIRVLLVSAFGLGLITVAFSRSQIAGSLYKASVAALVLWQLQSYRRNYFGIYPVIESLHHRPLTLTEFMKDIDPVSGALKGRSAWNAIMAGAWLSRISLPEFRGILQIWTEPDSEPRMWWEEQVERMRREATAGAQYLQGLFREKVARFYALSPEERRCPQCDGRGKWTQYVPEAWHVCISCWGRGHHEQVQTRRVGYDTIPMRGYTRVRDFFEGRVIRSICQFCHGTGETGYQAYTEVKSCALCQGAGVFTSPDQLQHPPDVETLFREQSQDLVHAIDQRYPVETDPRAPRRAQTNR